MIRAASDGAARFPGVLAGPTAQAPRAHARQAPRARDQLGRLGAQADEQRLRIRPLVGAAPELRRQRVHERIDLGGARALRGAGEPALGGREAAPRGRRPRTQGQGGRRPEVDAGEREVLARRGGRQLERAVGEAPRGLRREDRGGPRQPRERRGRGRRPDRRVLGVQQPRQCDQVGPTARVAPSFDDGPDDLGFAVEQQRARAKPGVAAREDVEAVGPLLPGHRDDDVRHAGVRGRAGHHRREHLRRARGAVVAGRRHAEARAQIGLEGRQRRPCRPVGLSGRWLEGRRGPVGVAVRRVVGEHVAVGLVAVGLVVVRRVVVLERRAEGGRRPPRERRVVEARQGLVRVAHAPEPRRIGLGRVSAQLRRVRAPDRGPRERALGQPEDLERVHGRSRGCGSGPSRSSSRPASPSSPCDGSASSRVVGVGGVGIGAVVTAVGRRPAVAGEPAVVRVVGLALALVLVRVLEHAVEDGGREADLIREAGLEGTLELVDHRREPVAALAAPLLVETIRALRGARGSGAGRAAGP